jgi:hypothetical protein
MGNSHLGPGISIGFGVSAADARSDFPEYGGDPAEFDFWEVAKLHPATSVAVQAAKARDASERSFIGRTLHRWWFRFFPWPVLHWKDLGLVSCVARMSAQRAIARNKAPVIVSGPNLPIDPKRQPESFGIWKTQNNLDSYVGYVAFRSVLASLYGCDEATRETYHIMDAVIDTTRNQLHVMSVGYQGEDILVIMLPLSSIWVRWFLEFVYRPLPMDIWRTI